MGCWSAENATRAYLKTMKMGKNDQEPDVAEFVSALAAGNNAQLMVVACAGTAGSTVLALVAAAQQTGGRVVCILPGRQELRTSKQILGLNNASQVEFVLGDARDLLLNHYKEADFAIIDCNIENHEQILGQMRAVGRQNTAVVMAYNAFCKDSWRRWIGSHSQLLPIGGGLLLTRIGAKITSLESDLLKQVLSEFKHLVSVLKSNRDLFLRHCKPQMCICKTLVFEYFLVAFFVRLNSTFEINYNSINSLTYCQNTQHSSFFI